MNRDNALELKSSILQKGLEILRPRITEPVVENGVISFDRKPHVHTFAAGIGRKTSETGLDTHTVELRIQNLGSIKPREIVGLLRRLIPSKAKKEVNINYVGKISIPSLPRSREETPWYQEKHRPLRCGASIGHHKVTAGTTGAFVKNVDRDLLVLSNNHVLAMVNQASLGDNILQPGSHDGGNESDICGTLYDYIKIDETGEPNYMDCALAKLDKDTHCIPGVYTGIGDLKGFCHVDNATDDVHKLGRTTGKTDGQIITTNMDNLMVNMGSFVARFDNQIELSSRSMEFSAGGDSGSLIIDDNLNAIGLLFAGSSYGNKTFACPIIPILGALGVELVLP